jgi:hypothetical protein
MTSSQAPRSFKQEIGEAESEWSQRHAMRVSWTRVKVYGLYRASPTSVCRVWVSGNAYRRRVEVGGDFLRSVMVGDGNKEWRICIGSGERKESGPGY